MMVMKMLDPIIEYITCESGDWYVLKKSGEIIYEGHSVPDYIWLGLLNTTNGVTLTVTALSDEDMQLGTYHWK